MPSIWAARITGDLNACTASSSRLAIARRANHPRAHAAAPAPAESPISSYLALPSSENRPRKAKSCRRLACSPACACVETGFAAFYVRKHCSKAVLLVPPTRSTVAVTTCCSHYTVIAAIKRSVTLFLSPLSSLTKTALPTTCSPLPTLPLTLQPNSRAHSPALAASALLPPLSRSSSSPKVRLHTPLHHQPSPAHHGQILPTACLCHY